MKVRLRDLDVVAEHPVEADLERCNARPLPLFSLNSRDAVFPPSRRPRSSSSSLSTFGRMLASSPIAAGARSTSIVQMSRAISGASSQSTASAESRPAPAALAKRFTHGRQRGERIAERAKLSRRTARPMPLSPRAVLHRARARSSFASLRARCRPRTSRSPRPAAIRSSSALSAARESIAGAIVRPSVFASGRARREASLRCRRPAAQ